MAKTNLSSAGSHGMISSYPAIYDFQFMPFALGDTLTWNIQTAIRTKKAGLDITDIHICLDPTKPTNFYQRELVNNENSPLLLSEVFGAFGTHPSLGDMHIYSSRERMLEYLRLRYASSDRARDAVDEYAHVADRSGELEITHAYFVKHIHSHKEINAYARHNGSIPLLQASRGCAPDIESVRAALMHDKRIVVVHPRLRRLDIGFRGDHTYERDSDFLEWYDFLMRARVVYPDVVFVIVGRLQEKPLALLRLPHVISLRSLGLGLGHELTLMREADLFIGTSSGFAAFANFSTLPYFITKMNSGACAAFDIPDGTPQLPFAAPRQQLVYGAETAEQLFSLLKVGLMHVPSRINTSSKLAFAAGEDQDKKSEWGTAVNSSALTRRFYVDPSYTDRETGFLLWPKVQEALLALRVGSSVDASTTLEKVFRHFPTLQHINPDWASLREISGMRFTRILARIRRKYRKGINHRIGP